MAQRVRVELCVSAVVLASLGGCAATNGMLYGASGRWLLTESTVEDRHYLDERPSDSPLVVEARLDTPPHVVCERRRHEPAARVTRDDYGPGVGGRLAYGLFAFAELGLASVLAFAPTDEPCVGCDVTAVFFGLDGLASLIMAFAIPDYHYREVYDTPPHDLLDPTCPGDVALEAGGAVFPVRPDGTLEPEHARSLMSSVVETGSAVALRTAGEQRWTPVPPELRCAWARHLGHALEPALCPRGPRPFDAALQPR